MFQKYQLTNKLQLIEIVDLRKNQKLSKEMVHK